MKTVFRNKRILAASSALAVLFVTAPTQAKAQVEVTGGGDVVSAYVWRGVYQSGASIQPGLGLEWKGLSVGAWGSTTLGSSDFKELDVAVGYSIGGFSAAVTDYYWSGQGGSFYDHYLRTHLIEGTLSYQFGPRFPLYVSWSTFFAGDMDKDAEGDRQYSSYFEVGYGFAFKGVDFTASVGGAPWDSHAWLIPSGSKKDFQISAVSLKASKDIRITKNYSASVFIQAIASPATDDANFIVGLSF